MRRASCSPHFLYSHGFRISVVLFAYSVQTATMTRVKCRWSFLHFSTLETYFWHAYSVQTATTSRAPVFYRSNSPLVCTSDSDSLNFWLKTWRGHSQNVFEEAAGAHAVEHRHAGGIKWWIKSDSIMDVQTVTETSVLVPRPTLQLTRRWDK